MSRSFNARRGKSQHGKLPATEFQVTAKSAQTAPVFLTDTGSQDHLQSLVVERSRQKAGSVQVVSAKVTSEGKAPANLHWQRFAGNNADRVHSLVSDSFHLGRERL